MGIRVALKHHTQYNYDRPIQLGPQVVRLRPAPHCRTPVLSYSMKVKPGDHFCNWQQDPQGNYIARLVFPEKTKEFSITVDLVADMTAINPFDFFSRILLGNLSISVRTLAFQRAGTVSSAKSRHRGCGRVAQG